MERTLSNTADKLKRAGGHSLPAVWWMTDAGRVRDPRAALGRLPRGSAVILRHYEDPNRAALARDLVRLCRLRGLLLIVAGDWRLAAAVGAAGCHLPEHAARRGPAPGLLLWRRGGRLLTAAAHSARALHRAAQCCDAVMLSPVFVATAYRKGAPLGTTRAALLARGVGIPVMALGGITAKTARALRRFGGIAGIGFGL